MTPAAEPDNAQARPTLGRLLQARTLAVLALALPAGGLAWWGLTPPGVPAIKVVRHDIRQTVVASGRVRPFSRVRLGASITGTVAQVLVREGNHVQPECGRQRTDVLRATAFEL